MRSRKPYQSQAARFKMGENRFGWVKNALADFVIMIYPPDNPILEEEPEEGVMPEQQAVESGENVRLVIARKRDRAMTLDLTILTEQEASDLRTLLNLAFDIAMPIIQLRDKEAQQAYEHGNDSLYRIYRAVPQFVVSKREGLEYPEGVQFRPDGAFSRTSPIYGNASDRLRKTGDDVADE
jgi:hypothetical protein